MPAGKPPASAVSVQHSACFDATTARKRPLLFGNRLLFQHLITKFTKQMHKNA